MTRIADRIITPNTLSSLPKILVLPKIPSLTLFFKLFYPPFVKADYDLKGDSIDMTLDYGQFNRQISISL